MHVTTERPFRTVAAAVLAQCDAQGLEAFGAEVAETHLSECGQQMSVDLRAMRGQRIPARRQGQDGLPTVFGPLRSGGGSPSVLW